MAKEKKQKIEKQETKLKRRVAQSTQKTIPIKDIANNTIITTDNRIAKIVEIYPIPFANLKPTQQNIVRQNFENLFKVMPESFQIKSVSMPSDLTSQIEALDANIAKESNPDKIRLSNEYRRSLAGAQGSTVQRKYYVCYSEDNGKKTKLDEIEKTIQKLNSKALQVKSALSNCGNGSKDLKNSDIAKLFYFLYNRNSNISFEKAYETVYKKYLNNAPDKNNFYIQPTEYIAPEKIYFTDKKYLAVNDRFYTHLYFAANGYPKDIYCGILDMFVSSFEGVDVDVFFRKKDDRKMKENLRRTIGHVTNDASEVTSNATDSAFNIGAKYQSAYYLLECLNAGQSIYDVSIMLTVSGNNLEEVNYKAETLIEESKRYDIKLRDLRYQEEEAFISTLPLNYISPRIEKKAKRNMPRVVASCLYIFTAFQLCHDDGVFIANDASNSPVIPNFWDTSSFINPHICCFGGSGAGKTSAMELFAMHANVMNIPIFIIAPQKQDDYKRLCQFLGGQWVEFGEGTPTRMNIMEIFPMEEETEEKSELIYGDLGVNKLSLMKQRQGIVTNFIHEHYTEMTRGEIAILGDALTMAYNKKGITDDNDSLWADEAHTHYKEMPILSDVLDCLVEMNNPDAKGLILEMKFFTSGIGSYFNGQTNIDVDNNFFVIGLENNSKETKPLSVYLAEDFCQSKIRRDRNKKFFMIDEMWDLLERRVSPNGTVHESLSGQKLAEDAKLLRAWSCSLVCGSQQLGDVLGCESGQRIIKNSETRILMKHSEEDIKYVSQYIDLTAQEKKNIQTFMPGQALFLSNQSRIDIQFAPTDFEGLIIFNDKKTLERYEQYVKNKRANEADEKRVEEMKSIAKPMNELHSTNSQSDANVKDAFAKYFG